MTALFVLAVGFLLGAACGVAAWAVFSSSGPEGDSHASTDWQVTTDADTGFAAPVVDVSSAAFLVDYIAEGLTAETPYRARVRYVGAAGGPSDWSDPVTFTTEASAPRPNTPTVTVEDVGTDYVLAAISAFSHPDIADDPSPFLLTTQWQIRLTMGGVR